METQVVQRSSTERFASFNAFERAYLKGIISSLGYDYIAIPPLKNLALEEDATTREIKKVFSTFPFVPSRVVFSSASLNPFINQLIAHSSYVVEVEKEYLQPFFDVLRTVLMNRVLLNPSIKERTRYFEPGIVCIYPLMTKSPVSKDGIVKLEKLIVDLIVSDRYRVLYSGFDIRQALTIICNQYAINYRTLFAYAARKRKTREVYSVLEEAAKGQIKEMLHAIEKEGCVRHVY